MTSPTFSDGSYTCANCGVWVPWNTTHFCQAISPDDPMAANTAALNRLATAIEALTGALAQGDEEPSG